jgi:tetratricopeptide (TPR) repeat protein
MEIAEVAGDLLAPADAQRNLAHIAECETCARALRQAIYDLERDLVPAEEEAIAEHLTHHPAYPRLPEHRKAQKWQWKIAAAALLLISAGSWFYATRSGDVPALLAQASADARPFDWRIPDAAYGRSRTQRGSESTAPAALLEAQAELLKRSDKGTTEYLRLQGWSELLERQTQAAVRSLEQAQRLAPDSLDVAGLLGVAYAESGKQASAIAELTRVLTQHPHDRAALYNRGLAYSRQGDTELAVRDWRALLEAEPTGSWSVEVHNLLKEKEGAAKLP